MLQIKLPKRVLRDYSVASSIEEAVGYLGAHQGEARVVGGGTDLLPLLQRGDLIAPHLVDVSHIAALRKIAAASDEIVMGGATPLATVACHEQLAAHCRLMTTAAACIGTPAVRRLATVAGNIACGWGNSEVALSLLALDAEAEIHGYMGPQWVPVRALYGGGGVSRLDATREVLSAVRCRAWRRGRGASLERLRKDDRPGRAALVVVVVVTLRAGSEQSEWPLVEQVAVALGIERQPPRRHTDLEATLADAPLPVARSLLGDGMRDALLDLGSEHALHQRLDEAIEMTAACWDRATRSAWETLTA